MFENAAKIEPASERFCFDPIEDIICDIAEGRMVIMVDDEDRENEGDLIIAGVFATVDHVTFMARRGCGLICVAISEARAKRFGLEPMVAHNNDPRGTAFTISIDARDNIGTGISASDRSRTILTLAAEDSSADSFVSPGHVFPLTAKPGGVLDRRGHTEAAIDMMILAGLNDVGVICEIMGEDGEMLRGTALHRYARRFGLKIGTIEALSNYISVHGRAQLPAEVLQLAANRS